MSLTSFLSLGDKSLTTSFYSRAQLPRDQWFPTSAVTLNPGPQPSSKILIQLLGEEVLRISTI